MKKLATVAFVLSLLLCMFGCGKPAGMSQETYDIGNGAVKVTEQYLNGDISGSEASDKLEKYSDDMDSVPDIEASKTLSIRAGIGYLASYVEQGNHDDEVTKIVDDLKNNLTDTL